MNRTSLRVPSVLVAMLQFSWAASSVSSPLASVSKFSIHLLPGLYSCQVTFLLYGDFECGSGVNYLREPITWSMGEKKEMLNIN